MITRLLRRRRHYRRARRYLVLRAVLNGYGDVIDIARVTGINHVVVFDVMLMLSEDGLVHLVQRPFGLQWEMQA